MKFFEKAINLGLDDSLSESENRGVKILNVINIFTLILNIFSTTIVNILAPSLSNFLLPLFFFILTCIPLLLNYLGKTVYSRVVFILISYLVILSSSIIYGGELHFQYFIIVAISSPLLLFDKEIGSFKWLLVLIALPQGLYQELHFVLFEPIKKLGEYEIYWIRLSNDFILFSTVVIILIVFTNKNFKQYRNIEKSNLRLKQKNLELHQFAHIISHDLKVPLRRINSLTDIIVSENQENFDNELNDTFELIKSSVKKMDHLILAVFEYSKAGREGLEITTFNSEDLFLDVLSTLNPPEELKVVLPVENVKLTASYDQLHQVFTNLIENALKYHNKKDGFIKIGMIPTIKNLIEFNIEDDGPGIPSHFHNKLLQIFQTANVNYRKDSTGLGLAIVKKLVEQNGGTLTFNSVFGKGSTFSFTWPLDINKSLEFV